MRKLLAILFISSFFSCSDETEQPEELDIFGEWILVQTTGQFEGSEQVGEDMPFQETYDVKEDGTFTKTRLRDGEEMKVTGTYQLSDTGQTLRGEEAHVFIAFQHESQNPTIANCTQTLIEDLYFTTNRKLISLYEACDGTGLLYEKLND